MKAIVGLFALAILLLTGGCVVEPAYPSAGVSVGVYGEYPHTYYGHGYFSFGFQDNSFSLSAEKKEELGKFYKNREKEIENYKREKSLRQNQPTREEKI